MKNARTNPVFLIRKIEMCGQVWEILFIKKGEDNTIFPIFSIPLTFYHLKPLPSLLILILFYIETYTLLLGVDLA